MGRTLIIAEAGVNHNGDMELAKKLIDSALDAGVDIVKFQTFVAEKLMSKNAPKAEYQIANTGNFETQLQMLKKLEIKFDDMRMLRSYAKNKNIRFLSTAFDNESVEFLKSLNLGMWKIPSGEITNYPYLKKIGSYGEKVIISTGMSDLQEVKDAIAVITSAGTSMQDITVLHCTTEYPTPMQDVNLRAIVSMREELKVNIGYSDHTEGIEIPVAAVALGATVIEKHFTLDKNMEGPDHRASLEPDELKAMVKAIRNIESALGSGYKTPSSSEKKNIAVARKSIVASCDISAGEIFSEKNVTAKRPGTGISPMKWNEVIGKSAKRDFKADELIEL